MKKIIFIFFASAIVISAQAQKKGETKPPANWFNLSYATDKVHGIGTERTYAELIQGRKADTIIVAVIDGGVDYAHEDLKDVMWHNPGEIPGNKIDDDKNGYVDDIYGWNFIGNANGENVQFDNLELTRLYRPLYNKYKSREETSITAGEREEYNQYLKLKAAFDKEEAEAKSILKYLKDLKRLMAGINADIKVQRNVDTITYADWKAYKPSEQNAKMYKRLNQLVIKSEAHYIQTYKDLTEGPEQIQNMLSYNLNMDYDPRSIVGDNYENQNERYYGNPDVKGPDALHGTHVAGIIAANRFNNIGILGIATPVKIMAIRAVPNGDERDKDVANAIRYAVENGAKVINMSFGKSYGYNKAVVDEAVKFAESKGVLIVHAAGNDSKNNDNTDNFPNDQYLSGGAASNWIEVGALSWKGGKYQVAPFSNYGVTKVDVFAPGVDINSAKSNGGYINESGTSMASPVTAGAAALIRAYHPSLTPAQVKEIILTSSDKSIAKKKIVKPGEQKKKVKFRTLSLTAGMVDLYAAFKMAGTYK